MNLIPEYLPNTRNNGCLICNASRRPGDRIIDLERWIDFEEGDGYGALAMCETCGKELATLIGCGPDSTVDKLQAHNQELQAQIEVLEANQIKAKALL